MPDPITSTVAQLLFRSAPDLDFTALVADLRAALNDCPARDCGLSWDHEDIAIFELDNARIILAFTDRLPGRYGACLTIGVGADAGGSCDSGIAQHQGQIARLLADRINARFMSDRMLWKSSTEIASVELIDRMVDELPGLDPARPGLHTSPEDIDRMLARFDAETAEQVSELAPEVPARRPRPRRPQRPTYRTERPRRLRPETAEVMPANDAPAMAHHTLREMYEIREALRDPDAPREPVRSFFGLKLRRDGTRLRSAAIAAAGICATYGTYSGSLAPQLIGY
ncbi:hypothetical protein [Limimaricola pyoseonensis]|uniref:Uncharacterized protein n=1 Tax=Limimaricola pyoseonensis TaxID=521013 RepID=A0A1G6ZSV2_9RHOB|nr:hypothetical protein [Limimaricola pyoseonensis]SDE05854.1 hypothetical protein SAMN04488567_0666 [Limimaricola pyoseonensis]